MDSLRSRIAACFDIAPDGQHATLAVAARLDDGRARVEIAGAWKTTEQAHAELPGLLARIRPRAIAWYPAGPGGAFATVLRPPSAPPPPRGPEYIELTGNRVPEVCMELADLVRARQLVHSGDEILTPTTAARASSAPGMPGDSSAKAAATSTRRTPPPVRSHRAAHPRSQASTSASRRGLAAPRRRRVAFRSRGPGRRPRPHRPAALLRPLLQLGQDPRPAGPLADHGGAFGVLSRSTVARGCAPERRARRRSPEGRAPRTRGRTRA